MAEPLEFVHASGGLLARAVLADAMADVPKSDLFRPAAFAYPGRKAEPPAAHAETEQTVFSLARERYEAVAPRLDQMPVGELRERWLIPLLLLLDFEPVFQRAHLSSEDGRDRFAISHLGWSGEGAPPVLLVREELDAAAGRGRRSPHEELQAYLNRAPALWGIVANGRRLRILRDFHHEHVKAFVGFDLDAIFETGDFPSFRALYRLAHRSRFVPVPGDEEQRLPLEILFEQSREQGIEIGRELQRQVRVAIEALAEGLFDAELRALLDDPKEARALYHELLLIVYRLLFLLFAEQRKMLPAGGIYAETYSVTSLVRLAEGRHPDPRHKDLWEGLKVTFRMLHDGAPEAGVFPYNGQLFDPRRTERLTQRTCENKRLLDAIGALTHVRAGGVRQRVNYAELGVEELGSVYESLLNETLVRAHRPLEHEGRVVPAGGIYLAPLTTERKDLGAFYTPPELVDFALSVSLDRLIAERLERAGGDPAARERALLDLRVCDPACGSGAFLVGAVDRLALALATERCGGQKPTEEALRRARRDVLRHSIYGVDKDAFAVELCKVALWIHCAVPDLPLSFLDHRIQHGDSLVGWPLLDIPTEIPEGAYTVPSKVNNSRRAEDRRLKAFLRVAAERNREALAGQLELGRTPPMLDVRVDFPAILEEDERVPADVEKKEAAYRAFLASEAYRRFEAAANLWAASFFWSPDAGAEAPTAAHYRRALAGEVDPRQAEAARALLEEFPAFHWPLRFPEIRARGGFDAIVGNPPWEQVKLHEQEWFAPHRPDIARMTTAARRRAIEALRQEDPGLYRRWRLAEVAYQRMAEFMRHSGRYTASGHEPNTYLLFAETAADMIREDGRAGILVKSALALDKSASALFSKLVEAGQVEEFQDILNGVGKVGVRYFPTVHLETRFAVVGLRGARSDIEFAATLMNWNVDEAATRPRQRFDPGKLAILNPKTRTLTSFRKPEELAIALELHRRWPILDFENGGENPWGLGYCTLFNSTTASRHFFKREDLEARGWVLGPDKVFRLPAGRAAAAAAEGQGDLFADPTSDTEALPLYEGQLMNRYDHRARTYEGYAGKNKYGRKPHIPHTTDVQKADPAFEIEPRYWMLRGVAETRLREKVGDRIMIAFRDNVSVASNQRCAKGAVLPRVPATETIRIFLLGRETVLEFLGLFNATLFDFLVRGHMPGMHVALVWMLAQIPAPPPGLDPRIADHARRLSLTSHSVARLFGAEPHRWDPEERYRLDVELDALVAHAYGVTRAQYATILDSFEVMARVQTRRHGRYKFKHDCLEAYRRLG
ncbi:MAG: hypothetical protein KatS3mg102_2212 [Planctomycetota bacterium]|nr:MAG: hypothetical protein KatS3mg102_2212 [Planctomycetota bacterium]